MKLEFHCGSITVFPTKYWVEKTGNYFYLHSEFMSLGPFESEIEIRRAAKSAGMKI